MLKSLAEIAARWGLTDVLVLLGPEAAAKIKCIVEIDELLHSYFGEELANTWLFRGSRNPLFGGKTPASYMLNEGIPGMEQVAKLLRGMCQHG